MHNCIKLHSFTHCDLLKGQGWFDKYMILLYIIIIILFIVIIIYGYLIPTSSHTDTRANTQRVKDGVINLNYPPLVSVTTRNITLSCFYHLSQHPVKLGIIRGNKLFEGRDNYAI